MQYRAPLPLLAFVAALACADPVAPTATTAPSSQPSFATAAAAPGPVRIEIKFHEARGVRLAAGRLRERNGRQVGAAERALTRRGGVNLRGRFAHVAAGVDGLRRAAGRRGRAVPDLDSWYTVEAPDSASAAALVAELRDAPEVAAAYPAPAPQAPPGAPRTATRDAALAAVLAAPAFAAEQDYFTTTAEGTGAELLRTLPGGDGRGIQIVDVEYAWHHEHEDLLLDAGSTHLVGTPYLGFGDDHGTAVLGILGARDNGFGVTGGVPAATLRTVAPFTAGCYAPPPSCYDPATAIVAATARMAPGDVLLVEQQAEMRPPHGGAYGPIEWIPSVYDAIRAATAAGIVVVEAAGNGGIDLDGLDLGGRFDPAVQHSGAIIVGAGDHARERLWFSSYGARVDVQGRGEKVTTTGFGDLHGWDGPVRSRYTRSFGGTSSATAIVAATVAAIQGHRKATSGTVLDAAAMAALLRGTGRPQTETLGQQIGPSPDLVAALGVGAAPALAVDIMPGSDRNPVNLRGANGKLTVAVLSTAAVDAAALDPRTVTLGNGAGAEAGVRRKPNGEFQAGVEDVDHDGRPDQVFHFVKGDLIASRALTRATTALELTARRADGTPLRGRDVVTIVP
jgi:hypothetical protein